MAESTSFKSRWLAFFLTTVIVGFVFLLSEERQEESFNGAAVSEQLKVPLAYCGKFCEARLAQRVHHYGGDWLVTKDMLKTVKEARDKQIEKLKVDYGPEYFDAIFLVNGTSIRQLLVSANETHGQSLQRFQRKLQMKILSVQMALQEENKDLEGCNCTSVDEGHGAVTSLGQRRRLEDDHNKRQIVLPDLESTFAKFVWATGGHSAAAGHGNLFNESYTAYMEAAAADVFAAAGIEFIGRNHAMGGMSSAPELALCMESVYGADADVISWDFGK